jgi:hypothetical protein
MVAVVPDPRNGSQTTSPGEDAARITLSMTFSGTWLRCLTFPAGLTYRRSLLFPWTLPKNGSS